jgi:LPXTG-site transpeptidase (sortase) family protein
MSRSSIKPGWAITHYEFSGPLTGASNAVLYGHDDIEGGVFGKIIQLKTGDAIELRTAGKTVRYHVTEKPRLVAPSALEILSGTSTPVLTLFSCWPLWVDNQRVVVVAKPD